MGQMIARGCGLLAAALAAAGCGSSSGTVPVRGAVKLDGQPLVGVSVTFVAQGNGGRDAYGSTDANGAFELTTFQPRDGALPGQYKVVILPTGEEGGSTPFDEPGKPEPRPKPKSKRPQVPVKYTVPGQTPLTQEVPSKAEVVIELSSK